MKGIPQILHVKLSVGSYPGSAYEVSVDFVEELAEYQVLDCIYRPSQNKTVKLSEEQIKQYLKSLHEVKIFQWKPEYKLNFLPCAGTNWSIEIKTVEKVYILKGYKAYPEKWEQFLKNTAILIGESFD